MAIRQLFCLLVICRGCIGEPRQQPLAGFLLDFLGRKQPTSTIFYHSEDLAIDASLQLDVALMHSFQRQINSYVTIVPLPPPAELEQQLLAAVHQSTCHVILTDDDVSIDFLDRMKSRCVWEHGGSCLVLSRGNTATDQLARRFIPVDIELLVGQVSLLPGGMTSVDLLEVYHLGQDTAMRRGVFGSWSSEEGLIGWDERSIFDRRGDWSGLSLRVASIQEPPYTDLIGDENPFVSGMVGEIWSHVAGALNFTYTVERSVDGQFGMLQPDGNWTGLIRMLVEDRADIAVAALGVSNQRNDYVDFTRPLVEHRQHVFLNKPPDGDPISGAFMYVFHWPLLLALGLCAVLSWWAMTAMYRLERKYGLAAEHEGNYSTGDSLVLCLSAVFQQGPYGDPNGLGSRFFLWTLFVAMFMINASYSAVLTSYLTFKNEDTPLHNFEEFLEDGTLTLGVMNNTSFLEYFKNAKQKNLQDVYQRHVQVMSDADSIQRRMKADMKFSYLATYQGTEDCNFVSFRADGFSSLFAFAVQDKSPYTIYFNHHLSRLDEGGIIDRLDRMWTYVPLDQCVESNQVIASMSTVFTAFTFLGVGVAVSVALLTAEVFWFRRKRDRARARDLLRKWGGRGQRIEAVTTPWRPAQAASKFQHKHQTAKAGIFLSRVQKLQQQKQLIPEQKLVAEENTPNEDDITNESNFLLQDLRAEKESITGKRPLSEISIP